MDQKMREIVDAVKKEIVGQVDGMRQANRMVPVSGKRCTLPLEGRTLDAVYYEASREHAPLIMGFHGGGFLFGGCALDDQMWDAMRNALDVNIISIDYRKTPEYMYPAPIEDAYDSAVYLKEHAEEYGFDPEHISVCGNSAGANISAAVSIYAQEKGGVQFDYQILNYPVVDNATDPMEKGDGSLDAPFMYAVGELYFPAGTDLKNPVASPFFASKEQLAKMPKAIIRTASNDSLRAEGEAYAKKLEEAGVEVYLDNAEGMPHGYFEYGFSTGMGMDYLGEAMQAMMRDGSMQREAKKALEFIKSHFNKN